MEIGFSNHFIIKIRSYLSEGFWVVIGQILSAAGSLELVRVLTKNLDPNEYGRLAIGLTLSGLVNQTIMGGINNGITRYYSIAEKNQNLGSYFQASRCLIIYASFAVGFTGVILTACLFLAGYNGWIILSIIILLFSLVAGCNLILINIQNAARERRNAALFNIIDAWLKILILAILVSYIGTTCTIMAIGIASSASIVLLIQCVYLKKKFKFILCEKKQNKEWLKKILDYSLPFSYWGAFSWVQQSSDRWALQICGQPADVGKFTLLYQLGFMPISILCTMVVSFVGPIFFQRAGETKEIKGNYKVHSTAWNIVIVTIFISIAFSIAAWYFNKEIFDIFSSHQYSGASYLLPWVVLAGGIFAAGQILTIKLMSELRTKSMTFAKIMTSLMGIILNILGASIAGLEGVVCALMAFSMIYIVWIGKLSRQMLVAE